MASARESFQLEEAMREFSSISRSLVTSYTSLSERAERVELELSRTNAELARKVDELDAVTRKLEAILEALPTGVVVRDACGEIVRINSAALEILDAAAEDVLGRRTHELLRADRTTGEPVELQRPDGSRRMVASRLSTVHADDGQLDGSVEILDDQTELVALGRRVHAMDKAAALGTMAGGIAHEIRNPLNAVQGFANLLAKELEPGSKASQWASKIVAGAAEANAIIGSMLGFAAPERLACEPIDPERLARDAVDAALREHADRSPWEVAVDCHVPPYMGDRIKLRQAVRNLVSNALIAQPDGGRVRVEEQLSGGDVVIRVLDSGPGIPQHARGQILDPFFTTRAEGTGLGLALVHSVAQLHGGSVEVGSDPSPLGGAELAIRFPFTPATSQQS